jgi:hypothetical protein
MAKKLGFTIERLEAMGLTRNEDGTYSKKHTPKEVKEFEMLDIIPKLKVNDSPDFEHKVVTEWFIPYTVPSKKNSRINFVRNGKQMSLPSKNHAEYIKLTEKYYDTFGVEFRNTVAKLNIQKPYKIEFKFVRKSHHSFDYCNACQTCEDMMKDQYKKKVLVRKGWFEDDSVEFLIPSFKPYEYDKNNPGVHIKLLK